MKPITRLLLIGLLSATLFVSQLALSALPNVELVTFFIVIFTLTLPFSVALFIVLIFVTLQMMTWGLGDWVFGYLWIWPLLVLIVKAAQPMCQKNNHYWAILSGLWGVLFGGLFAIHHGLLYGMQYSLIYWIRGISFDIIHGISNYILMLLLFHPVLKLFEQLTDRLKGNHYESDYENRRPG